jgi:hypothetical protein
VGRYVPELPISEPLGNRSDIGGRERAAAFYRQKGEGGIEWVRRGWCRRWREGLLKIRRHCIVCVRDAEGIRKTIME